VQRGGDMDGYWGEGFWGQGEWNDLEHHGKGGVLGEWKIPFDVYKGGLEVLGNWGCLCGLYGMELGNDTGMTFFEQFFHAMRTDDLR
jgi:hypothetical protein